MRCRLNTVACRLRCAARSLAFEGCCVRTGRYHRPRAGCRERRAYVRRVHRLALAYVCLFFASLVGIFLLVWWGQFFVTLTQRSNVETLTIAFFIVLVASATSPCLAPP